MPKLGCYYISHPGDDVSEIPDQILLDQNVCTDIYGFYYGISNKHREDLRNLLLSFPFSPYKSRTHINSGWAIEEYSWERTGEYHDLNRRSYEWAVQQVLNWEPARVELEFSQRRPPCERDKIWKKCLLPIPEKTSHPLFYLILHYGLVLKLCSLLKEAKRRGGQQGREWAFNQFLSWMIDCHGYLLAYEAALAKFVLLPSDNKTRLEARNILHLGGSETPDEMADRAWAAAWDMFYVRYADPSGLSPARYKNIAIVSEDDDPSEVNSRARLVEQISDLSVFISESEFDLPRSEYATDLGYGIKILSRSRPRDAEANPYRALDDLERALGVKRRTITAFLECPGDVGSSLIESVKQLDCRT